MRPLFIHFLLGTALAIAACGDDGGTTDGGRADGGSTPRDAGGPPRDGGGAPSDGGGTRTDGGAGDSTCMMGCELAVAAACSGGPATLDECVDDCEMLRTGPCAADYQAFLDCGEGMSVTCDAAGLPTVAACMTERDAFIACLSS